jgi:hypothetical protein
LIFVLEYFKLDVSQNFYGAVGVIIIEARTEGVLFVDKELLQLVFPFLEVVAADQHRFTVSA